MTPSDTEIRALIERDTAAIRETITVDGGPDRVILPSGAVLEGEGATAYHELLQAAIAMGERAGKIVNDLLTERVADRAEIARLDAIIDEAKQITRGISEELAAQVRRAASPSTPGRMGDAT